MKAPTAEVANSIFGDKLYQKRARLTLPILVRQAEAGSAIFYSDLAKELNIPNPRNLNYVLGSIGKGLEELSRQWGVDIPPIQCIVCNKSTRLPGEGIGWFLDKSDENSKLLFTGLSNKEKKTVVDNELIKIYLYRDWEKVLKALSLSPIKNSFSDLVIAASNFKGGGESQAHKTLKEYVAKHPKVIGLKINTPRGETERPLPSGDCLDVSFSTKKEWVAVEVKSAISNDADILRGLFQCVKYRAVIEAVQATGAVPQNGRAVLVLEGGFPAKLLPMKNILGVEVFEFVIPNKS
jgi:hypothetical protein